MLLTKQACAGALLRWSGSFQFGSDTGLRQA